MDSRERVLRVLKHEEADRVPFIDFAWGETPESPCIIILAAISI